MNLHPTTNFVEQDIKAQIAQTELNSKIIQVLVKAGFKVTQQHDTLIIEEDTNATTPRNNSTR